MTDRNELFVRLGMDRREFGRRLGALGLSTLGAVVLKRALASDAREPPRTRAGYPRSTSVLAIADWTFGASAEFAVEVERHGAATHGFDGDVAGLWLREIEPTLRAGGTAIVGLTGPGVLFCLETLARDYRCGAVFRAERPAGSAAGWERVAARHALDAGARSTRGGAVLPPFEHVTRTPAAEPPLLAWAIAQDARRNAARHT